MLKKLFVVYLNLVFLQVCLLSLETPPHTHTHPELQEGEGEASSLSQTPWEALRLSGDNAGRLSLSSLCAASGS